MKHGAMSGARRHTGRAVLTALVSLALVASATSSIADSGLDPVDGATAQESGYASDAPSDGVSLAVDETTSPEDIVTPETRPTVEPAPAEGSTSPADVADTAPLGQPADDAGADRAELAPVDPVPLERLTGPETADTGEGVPPAVPPALSALPSAALTAGDIPLGTLQARVANLAGSSCMRYAVRGGAPSATSPSPWVTASGEAIGSHGSPGSGCTYWSWSYFSYREYDVLTEKSSVGIKPVLGGSVVAGQPFLLAQAVHYNNPLSTAGDYLTGQLQLRLGGFANAVITFPWQLWETDNGASTCANGERNRQGVNVNGCADRIVFDSQIPDTTLSKDGVTYKLVVEGFAAPQGSTCPTTMPSTTRNLFWTSESGTTTACVYASLSQVRQLEVVKTVRDAAGIEVPSFAFASDSSLDGSPWKSGFTLRPSASAGASMTRELLQGEDVTVVELPAADWRVAEVTCAGIDPRHYSVSGNVLTITDTPADIRTPKITCTFVNVDNRPGIEIVKQAWDVASAAELDGAQELPPGATVTNGTTLTWTYTVRNTGQTALLDIVVTDRPTVDITCPRTRLEVGEQMVCTGSAAVSPAS